VLMRTQIKQRYTYDCVSLVAKSYIIIRCSVLPEALPDKGVPVGAGVEAGSPL
jgi:hypothetical protein